MRRAALAVSTTALVAAALTAPVAAPLAAHATPTPTPSASPSLPTITQTVDPVTSVGGARLAEMNTVIVDAPSGVPKPPDVPDVAWVIADADTGAVVAAKNPHAHLLPASTLKTLTALLLMHRLDPKDELKATSVEAGAEGTRVGMVPGQHYTVAQLFQALIMSSGNDAAYGLATLNGGMDKTVDELNSLAAELGAHDTVVKDPSGLDAPGQVSSAYDLALFGRAAIADPDYVRLATTKQATFPGAASKTSRSRPTFAIGNHNRLVWNYPGALGVKNGYTKAAHRTFIGAAKRGDKTYIVTEMYGTGSSWRPAASLLDWAFAHGDKVKPVGRLVDRGEAVVRPKPAGSAATPTPAVGSVEAGSRIATVKSPTADLDLLMPPVAVAGMALLFVIWRRSSGSRRPARPAGRHRA
ncbi:D-alanyl-D-alanine carboxypeptidase family protein [Knoellia sinensis]|nr:serine hydrolase [Knoellia sinensis]